MTLALEDTVLATSALADDVPQGTDGLRTATPSPPRWKNRSEARAQRRRLAERDRHVAWLGCLSQIETILQDAAGLVTDTWLQDSWFAYRTADGAQHLVTSSARDLHRMGGHEITGVCLVGAVVQAGGGLATVATQPVQRALDLTWHALRSEPTERLQWCPPPDVRAAHVRDLTRWNDDRTRRREQVSGLLGHASLLAEREFRLARGQVS